jgi:GT2 family glycosyltransferase
VRLIENEENIGFARANNQAIRQSKGRYVLLLNPDTVLPPGTLGRLVQFMDRTPDAGVAGCKQVYADGRWQSTCHRMISLGRETIIALGLSRVLPQWVDYGDRPLEASEPFRVDWVGGACLIVRQDVLKQVGLLDEEIFLYAEDADLCQRVRKLGFRVYYLPQVPIAHHRGQSTLKSSDPLPVPEQSAAVQQFIGKRYVIGKHSGHFHATVYRGVIVLEMVRRLAQSLLEGPFRDRQSSRPALRARRKEYLAVLRATLSGQV